MSGAVPYGLIPLISCQPPVRVRRPLSYGASLAPTVARARAGNTLLRMNNEHDVNGTGKHDGSLHGSGTHDARSEATTGGFKDRDPPQPEGHPVEEEAGAGDTQLEELIASRAAQAEKR
jgi:hypothetical protein